jgi:uncharacterized MAPEG superfamily protein
MASIVFWIPPPPPLPPVRTDTVALLFVIYRLLYSLCYMCFALPIAINLVSLCTKSLEFPQ